METFDVSPASKGEPVPLHDSALIGTVADVCPPDARSRSDQISSQPRAQIATEAWVRRKAQLELPAGWFGFVPLQSALASPGPRSV
jgi:hypothetical protein